MRSSRTGALDAVVLQSVWGPRLMRFFYLLCADQTLAETLAIDTLRETIEAHRKRPQAHDVIQAAVAKAAELIRNTPAANDPLAKAVASLPRSQGCAIALVRGMGLNMHELAGALEISVPQAKRLFADSLLALHAVLFSQEQSELECSRED